MPAGALQWPLRTLLRRNMHTRHMSHPQCMTRLSASSGSTLRKGACARICSMRKSACTQSPAFSPDIIQPQDVFPSAFALSLSQVS